MKGLTGVEQSLDGIATAVGRFDRARKPPARKTKAGAASQPAPPPPEETAEEDEDKKAPPAATETKPAGDDKE